jgi:hypothetical protein
MEEMERPNFSGVWKFNRMKSSLQIPPPDSTTFMIEHHEPHFHLERTHTFGGSSDFFSIDLMTDGEPVHVTHGDLDIRARMSWDAESLLFHSEIIREGVHGTNIVRYRLEDEGRTFIALERLNFAGQNYENIWVFDRHG